MIKKESSVEQINQAELLKQKLEDEKKNKVKATVKKLFLQTKVGCQKAICFNQFCIKNPFARQKLTFPNDAERLKVTLKYCQEAQDPFALLCSDSTSVGRNNFDQATEK